MERERGKRAGGDPAKHIGDVKEKEEKESITWIVEVSSQMIFSSSAKVSYDILLARDEKSLSHFAQDPVDDGSFSSAIDVKIQDTVQLWNVPPFSR